MIGGELLDLNWKSYQTKTTKDVIAEADIFCLVFLGDLATIKGSPIINIIESSFNIPVALLGVKYCPKNLGQGVKNNSTFISVVYKPYLKQYNEKKSRTSLVLFYDSSNIQNSGQILVASYPQITVLHRGKHVLSIFFSKISKFPVIRVRQCYSYKYALVPYKHTFLHYTYNL